MVLVLTVAALLSGLACWLRLAIDLLHPVPGTGPCAYAYASHGAALRAAWPDRNPDR